MTRSDIQLLIDAIQDNTPNTALEVRTVLEAIADGTDQTGDVKEIDVTNAYLTANFDPTGLGTNERLGWAVCNGNNGTRDRGGKVSIGYNATYGTLGASGGSEDAVVVSHSHTVPVPSNSGGVAGSGGIQYNGANNNTVTLTTSTTGVSGVGKNMQPYIVSLYIMKL